jgi:hypothetical protein
MIVVYFSLRCFAFRLASSLSKNSSPVFHTLPAPNVNTRIVRLHNGFQLFRAPVHPRR